MNDLKRERKRWQGPALDAVLGLLDHCAIDRAIPPGSILVLGRSGTGKTFAASALALVARLSGIDADVADGLNPMFSGPSCSICTCQSYEWLAPWASLQGAKAVLIHSYHEADDLAESEALLRQAGFILPEGAVGAMLSHKNGLARRATPLLSLILRRDRPPQLLRLEIDWDINDFEEAFGYFVSSELARNESLAIASAVSDPATSKARARHRL